MSAPRGRGQGRGRGRGGLGKYLRARGRRGAGRPAEFGKKLRLEDEESDEEESEDEAEPNKYAKRQLGTNADRYDEPEVDPHVEQEPEPDVDLSSFLERQRLTDQEDRSLENEEEIDDGIDHSLSSLPSASSSTKTRKNKAQTIQWDASMDQLKRDKEAAEAVWDLKSRFRKNQPRLVGSSLKPAPQCETRVKIEDSRHVLKPLDADTDVQDSGSKQTTKAEMEDFLDGLLT